MVGGGNTWWNIACNGEQWPKDWLGPSVGPWWWSKKKIDGGFKNIILESETPKENFETNKKIHFRRRRGHCYFGKIFEILCNSYYEFILDCHPIRCGCGKDQFLLQVKSLRITLGPFEDRTFIGWIPGFFGFSNLVNET